MTLTNEERQRRGEEAKQLLEHPLLIEAFSALEAAYIDDWKRSGFGDAERREAAYVRLFSLQDLKGQLGAFIVDGDISKLRLQRS